MTILNSIAKELRDFAAAAHGNPPTVQITAKTLLEYANAIQRMDEAFVALNERLENVVEIASNISRENT